MINTFIGGILLIGILYHFFKVAELEILLEEKNNLIKELSAND